jgi:thiol-disulfide isomerase/thioredoxin
MRGRHFLVFMWFAWTTAAMAGGGFDEIDRAEAQALSNPASHSAPTIVALWSSECGHCKKNLLLFGQLVAENAGLIVITVATERPFEGLAEPLDLLAVPGKRLAYGTEMPEALAYALDPNWFGELPRTLFFDGRGGKITRSGVVNKEFVLHALGLQ